MQSNSSVSARDVLAAPHETQRLGHRRIIEDLEHHEPDLAENLMEGLSRIHHDLLGLWARRPQDTHSFSARWRR